MGDPLFGLLSTTGPLGYALHFTNTAIAKSGVDSKDGEDASSNIPKQRLNESRIHPHDLPRRPGIMSRACFDLAERGWGVYATVIRGLWFQQVCVSGEVVSVAGSCTLKFGYCALHDAFPQLLGSTKYATSDATLENTGSQRRKSAKMAAHARC
jgi:hypothetical protein